jgi:hypothetical protein
MYINLNLKGDFFWIREERGSLKFPRLHPDKKHEGGDHKNWFPMYLPMLFVWMQLRKLTVKDPLLTLQRRKNFKCKFPRLHPDRYKITLFFFVTEKNVLGRYSVWYDQGFFYQWGDDGSSSRSSSRLRTAPSTYSDVRGA